MCLSSPSSPFNDNPCSAASIPAANFCSNANGFTNVGATSESLFSTSIPTCWDAAGAQNTVWFTYTAIGAGNIIQVIGGGTGGLQRPQVIVLQTSNCAGTTWNASVFGCAQAASGVNSVTLNTNNNLIGGQTYLIGVDGFGGNTGSFQLCLNSFVPTSTVPNDLCSGAYSICPNQVFSASTQNATNTGDVPIGNWTCNGDLTKPVWYTFRTAATVNPISITISGTCTQSTSSGPGQIQFEVFNYTGTGNVCSGTNVNSMTSIGCTTTLSGTVNIPAASLQPNRTYYILVDDYPGSYCNFQFVLTGIPSTDAGVDQNVCESAAAFNLVGVPNGGQWFGPGITDATLGTFNPSVASIGSQTVYYRVGNCTDSKVINVTGVDLQLPNDMTICLGGSAQLSANAAPLPSTLIRTFSNNTITAIPDGNTTGITSNVTVSGVAPNTVGTNPIQRICLNIAHPSDNNLDISLIAPNGTVIDLSSDNGGTGDNYTNTCFVTGATSIASGTAPFTGDFAPEGSLTGAGISASAVNGTWGLRVIDDSGGNIGSLINWSIQFAQANSITYSWSPTTNMTNANTLSPTVSPTVNTTYTLTATDVTGCTASDAMVVSIVTPTVTITGNSLICPGGSTTLTASGSGTGTYLWSTGAVTSAITVNPSTTTIYAVTYNQGGCTATATVTVTISAITLTDTNTSVTCNGGTNGSVNLTVAGGTSPYTYNWGGVATEDRTNLTAGIYTVTVTDASSCTATRSVTITQPTAITLTNTSVNSSCNGGSNGSINLTVSGGTTPYTYNWGGVVTEDRTNLTAGVYTVTVTDANSCTATRSVTITQPTAITLTNTSVNVNCNGGTTGSINLTVSGGTTPYTYNWGGVVTEDRTNLAAGIYTVTVTDANSCTATRSVTITQPTAITLTNTSVNVSCNGGTNGSIDLTVAGGTMPYTYNWGGVVTEDRTNLTAGVYTVTVTDANSCTATRSVTITQPTAITLTNTSVNVSCNGGVNGSIDLTVSGGTTPYTYNWGGVVTEDRTNLTAGVYTVTVTDANSCTAARSVTITQPTAITLTNTTTSASCNGGTNGSIDLTVLGGTIPYTYNWGGGIITEDRIGLAANTYAVTVTDANSCTATKSIIVTELTGLSLTNTSVNVSCNGGSNGSIDLTAAGGITPYTYNWGGVSTEDRTGLVAGIYTVTVTDVNLCSSIKSIAITQPTAITLNNTSVNVSCNGGSNGSIDLTAAGGTTPYTYNWGGVVTEDRINLMAGIYTVTVTDANSCTATRNVTITQPTAITISSVITNASCSNLNGAIDVTVFGGRTPYTYNWGGVITEDRAGLAAGSYTLTVTDANACTSSQTFNLTTTVAVTATIVAPTRVLTCSTINIELNASTSVGGGTPLTYLWSTGEATSSITITAPNTYRVTVTETSSGCQGVQLITITTDYLKPTITLTSSSPSITCNTQLVVLDASGSRGTGALTYVWSTGLTSTMITVSNAGTYNVTVTNISNGCTATDNITVLSDNASPNIAISNSTPLLNCRDVNSVLGVSLVNELFPIQVSWSNGQAITPITVNTPNTYTVTVTNITNGCSSRTSTTVTQDIAAPNVSISAPITQFTCSTTRLDLTAQSQLGALASFAWSTGSLATTITTTTAGMYRVTVTNNSNFCTSATAVTLTSNTTPPAIVFAPGIRELNCILRTLNIDASGSTGQGTLRYNWSNNQTANNINVTGPGVVTLMLTDVANGCTSTASQTVTENIQAPTSVITPSATVLTCRTPLIELNANSSAPLGTLSFLWSVNNDSRPIITISAAGVYQLMVTNSINGCTATSNQTITTVPNTLQALASTTPALCNGGSTGSATINTTGGTAPISYLWSTSQNTATIAGLIAGSYQAVVTDANGCSTNVTATVLEPTVILLQAVAKPVLCNGDSNGEITLSTNGGTPNYTYSWSNRQTTANLTGISAGNYCVTVADAHNCQATTCINVATPQPVVITNTSVQNVTCFNADNGTIRVNVTGGLPNYTYNWSVLPSTNSNTLTGLKSGSYSLNVLDANGCKANQNFTITSPEPIQMTYNSTNLVCYGNESGSININQVSGGTTPYKFSIDGTNFGSNKVYTNLEAGSYSLYVRDLNGCTYTSPSITLTQPSQIQVVLSATKQTIELGDTTILNASILGRPNNLTFSWSPKDSLSCTTCERNILAYPSHTTSYRLTVESDKGCEAHNDITIVVNKNRSVYIPTGFTPNNDGINDAFMVYSAKGIKNIKTFRVFDRWGELLFENNNSKPNEPTSGWGGFFKNKAMIPDVYVYLIEIEFVDGFNQIYKGTVNLIH